MVSYCNTYMTCGCIYRHQYLKFACKSAAYKGPSGNLIVDVVFNIDGRGGSIDAVYQGIFWVNDLVQFGGLESFARMQGGIICDCVVTKGLISSRKRKFLGATLSDQHRFVGLV